MKLCENACLDEFWIEFETGSHSFIFNDQSPDSTGESIAGKTFLNGDIRLFRLTLNFL